MSKEHTEGLYRVFWDFYGPSAKPTAEHFLHHLNELISREALTESVEGTGVEVIGEGWCTTWCDAPLSLAQRVGRALNAKRAELKRPTPHRSQD